MSSKLPFAVLKIFRPCDHRQILHPPYTHYSPWHSARTCPRCPAVPGQIYAVDRIFPEVTCWCCGEKQAADVVRCRKCGYPKDGSWQGAWWRQEEAIQRHNEKIDEKWGWTGMTGADKGKVRRYLVI